MSYELHRVNALDLDHGGDPRKGFIPSDPMAATPLLVPS